MDIDLNELYQDIILDHYKNPHNFGEGGPDCTNVELDNPVCGDHIKLMIYVNNDGIIQDVKFTGSGCAISVASASIMTDEVKGKKITKVKDIINDVLETMRGEIAVDRLEQYGDMVALKGVVKFPIRVKCATLAWHAIKDAIKKIEENK